ncbi:MAG: DNA glycosylase AlkZ-like family protein [bacterium]
MPLTLTLNEARRLAVASQLLAGKRSPPTQRGIMETVRGLRHLQLDPTAAVAPSHLLVLWSRLGRYDPAELDALVRKGHLFEYCAFLYPTEEYPVHAWRMRHFGRWWQGEGIWPQRIRDFMEKNRGLRRQILTRLRREGSLLSRQFEGRAIVPWRSSGWYSGRNVSRMLEFLEWQGLIMVAGRREGQRLWDLTERVLPDWAPRQRLSEREFSRCVAEGMLRAAGVARARGDAWQWGPGTAPRPCARGIGTGRPGRTGRYPGRPPDPTGTLVRVVRCARPA